MTFTLAQNQAYALRERAHASRNWRGMCQMFTRMSWGVGAGYSSASIAWANADYRHTSWPPPPGAPVYWTGGSAGHGHAAVSAGNGNVFSTDILRVGCVDLVSIALINSRWGRSQHYVGWTEDINNVRVLHAGSAPPPPTEEEEDIMAGEAVRILAELAVVRGKVEGTFNKAVEAGAKADAVARALETTRPYVIVHVDGDAAQYLVRDGGVQYLDGPTFNDLRPLARLEAVSQATLDALRSPVLL